MDALAFSLVLLVLAIWAWVAFSHPLLALREWRTTHWPVVAGNVEAFDWQPLGGGKMVILFLYYSYKVNERFYSGHFSRVYDSYDSAYFAWLRWKGVRIPIRYKPGTASVSFFPEKSWRREQPAGFDRPPAN
jgi:hypothetical protein